MKIPKEQEYLVKNLEERFFTFAEFLVKHSELDGVPSKVTEALLSRMKEERLVQEIYNNTYSLYYSDEELTQISKDLEMIDTLTQKVNSLLDRDAESIEEKVNKIFKNYIEHNSDLFEQ